MSKLNKLISNWPPGLVYTTSYLGEQGYSPALLAQYKKNNWIRPVGKGAVARQGDRLDCRGALMAVQKQLGLPVHVGARTALAMHGAGHFVRTEDPVFLFAPPKTRLPNWFSSFDWGQEVKFSSTNLFKTDLGFLRLTSDNFSLRVSSRERALFEQLYLVPQHASFRDSSYLFQGLYTLRSDLIQSLLLECRSIKAKRLFMVVAEALNYPWVRKLDLAEVDFGRGNRVIDPGGKTFSKYNITVEPLSDFF